MTIIFHFNIYQTGDVLQREEEAYAETFTAIQDTGQIVQEVNILEECSIDDLDADDILGFSVNSLPALL